MIADPRKKLTDLLLLKAREIDAAPHGRFKTIIAKSLRLIYVVACEVTEGHLSLRAMSLVYTTLLSIVPLLALSFSVLKAFGVHNEVVGPFLLKFLSPLGAKGEEITARIIGFVDNTKVGVLGSIGLLMLIYTALSVIQKIEDAFNFIWKINKPRGLVQRFTNYISVMLIGPVLLFSAVGLTATFMSHTVVQRIILIEPFGTLLRVAGAIVPYIITCTAFTFFYIFIPNTKVRFKSALTGGILAGVTWEVTGWAFASFTVKSAHYDAIYSGFAILILFIIWIYMNWLILLVGAGVSFYHQNPFILTAGDGTGRPSNRLSERLAFLIMYFIGYNYHNNKPLWTLHTLAGRIGLPFDTVHDVLMLLKEKSLLLEIGDDPPAYLPAKDIETITLLELLNAVRTADNAASALERQVTAVPEVDKVMTNLDAAVSDSLGGKTLKDIVLSVEK